MDNEQAQFILQAYRPNGQDANDPQFREALAQVERDPSLARWFEAERSLDAAIAAKLKQAPVPAELKATILAGRKVIQLQRWWNRPPVVALAAALAFLLVAVGYWLRTKPPSGELTLAAFQRDMAATFGTAHRHEPEKLDLEQARQWLATHGGPKDIAAPAGLQGTPPLACDVIDWRGKKVTLLCYVAKLGGSKREVHLLVIDQAALPGVPRVETPQFAQVGNRATATWSHGDRVYVLAGEGDKASLQGLF